MRCEILDDQGQGPVLVYVPGIDGTGRMLLGCHVRLAARFRVIRLHYQVAGEASRDGYPALAASLAARLAERGIARAVLLAESFGGGVALQAALDHPDRVAGLALVNTFPFFRRRLRLGLARLVAPLTPPLVFHRLRAWLAPWSLFGRRREADAVRRFREEPGTWFDDGYRRRLRLVSQLDLRPRLPEIAAPVALFAGDRDRVVDSLRQARAMRESLSDATLEHIEGGGHLVLPLAGLPWEDWLAELCRRGGLS